jgi:DNA-binding beta-propeller fold protein YncE
MRAWIAALVATGLVAAPTLGAVPGRCQRAIEQGGRHYLAAVLAVAERCTAAGAAGDIANCLFDDLQADATVALERARWARIVQRRCVGTALGSALGYSSACSGMLGFCRFPTPVLDAPGENDDVLDCIACQMREEIRRMTVKLFQGERLWNGPADPRRACVEALGVPGFEVLRLLNAEVARCLRKRRSPSIAACLDDPRVAGRVEAAMAQWRAGAVAVCGALDPSIFDGVFGYSTLCAGPTGFPGTACRTVVAPCTLPPTPNLNAPGTGDDLLDCLRCRVEEAELAVARSLQGANLCCVEGRCGTIMTRAACVRAQGMPVHYRIDDADVPGFHLPHGLTFAPDGTMYVADQDESSLPYVATVAPDGTRTVLATLPGPPTVPTGLAIDAARNAYVSIYCDAYNVVFRVTPDGVVSVFAGTPGVAGHAGDGGPATEALIAGGRKTAVDATGNVYITESGFLTLGCPAAGLGNGEYVRMVDTSGIIHTVAGAGPYGSAGTDGPALSAELAGLLSIHVTPDGSMLLGEGGLQRLLRIDPLPPAGTLTHLAGRPTTFLGAYSGDAGPARLARFFDIEGIVQDADGNVIVSDFQNNRLRLVDTAGSVITIAGNGVTDTGPGPVSGDGGPAELAFLGCPQEAAQSPDGRIWFFNQVGSRRFRTLTRVPF